MKKIIISLVLFLSIPIKGLALDYEITDFLVKSEILDNGDLEVNELIVLDGTFNGYERDILYSNDVLNSDSGFINNRIYNATNISDVSIKAKYVDDVSFDTFNETFDSFTKVLSANNGDMGKYNEFMLDNGYRYRMYYKANDDKVAFYLKYIVEDALVLHNDVAELYWTFVPSGFEDTIDNVEIKVYLPKSDYSANFRIWAHGNLTGEVNFIDKNGLYAKITKVMPGDAVDIRTTFDKNLVNSARVVKTSYIDALNSIIEVETKRAEVANNLREKLLAKYNFVKVATNILFVVIGCLGIYIFIKYDKSPKAKYYSKYNREFIDDYNVEVIDYLMNKKITPNAMSASIMNLIYKKNIKAEEIVTDSKKNKDYMFILENEDNINESEKILIDFLFDKVGKGKLTENSKKKFTTLDLKVYAKGTKTCEKFIASYTTWKNNVIKLGKEEKFYDVKAVPKLIGCIILALAILLVVFASSNGVDYFGIYILIIIAVIFFIYTLVVDKKTPKGSEHYAKWKAFKNFLDDFGSFELKKLPEIILWERYLVYATIFGLAKKVQKTMNVKIKELEISNLDYDYYPSIFYFDLGNVVNTSVNSAITNAYSTQAANYANSHSSSSSGSGFGGGFSSGGGFGGGGGGGRGF